MNNFVLFRRGVLNCVLVGMALTGCRTPPNIKPFAQATGDLSASIKSAGRAVGAEITAITTEWPRTTEKEVAQHEAAEGIKAQFLKHWVARDALADGLMAYSNSLAAIVEAGNSGEQNFTALAGSFKKLCDTVGLVLPGAADIVAGAAGRVYLMLVQDRAARILGEGMQKMQGDVDRVVRVLDADLISLENALTDLRAEARPAIDDVRIEGMLPREERNSLRQNAAHQQELRMELGKAREDREEASRELARQAGETNTQGQNDARAKINAAQVRFEGLSRELADVELSIDVGNRRLEPIDREITATHARFDSEIDLVRTTRAGLEEWAATHARLALAAIERVPPRVEPLVQIASDIRDLVKEVRSHK